MTDEKRYDVVVFNVESRIIESIVGKNMSLSSGTHNAERRRDTLLDRINKNYDVAIVRAGIYTVGARLKRKDEI